MHTCHIEHGAVKQLLIYKEVDGKRIIVFEPDTSEFVHTQAMPAVWEKKKNMDADDSDILYNVVSAYLDKRYSHYPQFKNAAITIHCPINGFALQIPLVVAIEYGE